MVVTNDLVRGRSAAEVPHCLTYFGYEVIAVAMKNIPTGVEGKDSGNAWNEYEYRAG
jgi:hypothetical protein